MAEESMLRMESASMEADILGRQSRPKRFRQMSPLVYTCSCRGVGCKK